jgi:N-acetylneuraminic acid mutarotase
MRPIRPLINISKMKKAGLLSFIVILKLCSISIFGQEIDWIKKSDIPIQISKAKAAVVRGKIYIIGGATPSFNGFSTVNYEYSPETDSWSKKKDIPTGRTNYAIAVVQNKIYVIGGDPFSDKVEVFDPLSNSWNSVSNMPSKRQHISCAVVDDKIYVIGGFEDVCCPPFPEKCDWDKCAKISDLNQVYDPKTDSWKTLKPIPTKRHGHDIAAANGKIYVIGGMGNSTSIWSPLDIVEEYNPATDTWLEKNKMPTPRDGFGLSVINNNIYVFGGWNTENQQTNETVLYDTRTNNWHYSTKIPVKTGAFAYATIGEKIFFFGGDKEDYQQIYSFNYEGVILK